MSNSKDNKAGMQELKRAFLANWPTYLLIAFFSFFANLLMLTGPLYMLQVFNRVLTSQSVETLVALTVLAGFLYVVWGVLEWVRGRILVRIGANFQSRLEKRVFQAVQDRTALGFDDDATKVGMRDLETLQRTLSSPVIGAFFDVPWTPIFLLLILSFHPLLGTIAIVGGAILVIVAIINQMTTHSSVDRANMVMAGTHQMADGLRNNAELLQGLGMRGTAYQKMQANHKLGVAMELRANDLTSGFSTVSKTIRFALQSAIMGTGAYLVLFDNLTPGVMIASSIIMSRALAPIEMLIAQWPLLQRAAKGRERLAGLLTDSPERKPPLPLGNPAAKLQVESVNLATLGADQKALKPILRGLNFSLGPGQALGVLGTSGVGKSSLAKAIIGVLPPVAGKIRLDKATLNQYDIDELGRYIGYLPQQVTLFNGTISENIARLDHNPEPAKVIEAAKKAAVHEMILQLPLGYDTPLDMAHSRLSGGQIQRIGLARAFYGNPPILVLDEPNSNLDHEGSRALNIAIANAKKAGSIVIVMAHRPAAIQLCDFLLILENGVQKVFGPKEAVMREHIQNAAAVSPLPQKRPTESQQQSK